MNNVISIFDRMPLNNKKVVNLKEYVRQTDLTNEIKTVDYPFISLIIPALNEEKSIGLVLQAIPKNLVGEIIVVDNGSTDRTVKIARHFGAKVVCEFQKGYGAACLAGIASISKDCEIVAFVDADFSDFPEDLDKILLPILDNQAEMVIGTRTAEREAREALTPQQRYGNWLATSLVKLFFGQTYTDLGPFRAIRREALEGLKMTDRNFGWTIEMQIKAAQHKLRIAEIPVRYRIRVGRSKISGTVKGTISAGTKIIYTIFKYALKK